MSEAAQKQQQNDFHTDMAVGEILRRAREHYGQSLDQVERNLRIRAIQLDALEKGDISQLPGRVYAIGFVRSYAEYLGFDGDKMVSLFKKQSYGTAKPEKNLSFPVPASESKLPAMPFAVIAAVVGVILIAVWAGSSASDTMDISSIPPVSKPETQAAAAAPQTPPAAAPDAAQQTAMVAPSAGSAAAPEVAASTPQSNIPGGITVSAADGITPPPPVNADQAQAAAGTTPAPEQAQVLPAAATAAPAPAITEEQKKGIILNVTENSWVEIRDANGKALVSRVLQAGDQYFVPDSPDLTMSLGNASGVTIVADGVEIGPLGAQGQVRRGISLNARTLKSMARKTR